WADRQANTDPNIVTEESVSWKMAQTTRHFLDLWQKILPHYTRAICPEDCPCNYLPYLVSSAKNQRHGEWRVVCNVTARNACCYLPVYQRSEDSCSSDHDLQVYVVNVGSIEKGDQNQT